MKAKLKNGVSIRVESDEYAIIYDSETGKSFVLDPSAVFIGENLQGKLSAEEISVMIKDEFEDVPEDVQSYVKKFIQSLVKNNLAQYIEV